MVVLVIVVGVLWIVSIFDISVCILSFVFGLVLVGFNVCLGLVMV